MKKNLTLSEMTHCLYKARGYTNDLPTLALGLCEEAGEVAKAVNTYHNPNYVRSGRGVVDKIPHELYDTMVYALAISNAIGIDLVAMVEKELKMKLLQERMKGNSVDDNVIETIASEFFGEREKKDGGK